MYKLMESFFLNFEYVFKLMPENRKILKRIAGVNIDQIAMCYISMDLSRQALQTNRKLFSNFGFFFFFLIIVAVGPCMRAFVLNSTHSSYLQKIINSEE